MHQKPYQPTVLIVDDMTENLAVLNAILEHDYRIRVATSGERALRIVFSDQPPDLVLLDIMMPGMDGYEVCRRIKADPVRRTIPLLFVTSMEEQEDEALGLALGAEDYITKPYSPGIVVARVKTQLALYNQTRELERKVDERTREMEGMRLKIIQRLGRAAEFRDNETSFHVTRLSLFCRAIGLAHGLQRPEAERLMLASTMHDIGKIGTPDTILQKPGQLTPSEWNVMQQHSAIGADIIGQHDDPLLDMARCIALWHHERWDGSGYPHQLRGEAIPLAARIVALADVFDALMSMRPYKPAWPLKDTIKLIHSLQGRHFDPALMTAFTKALPEMLDILRRYPDQPPGEAPEMIASTSGQALA